MHNNFIIYINKCVCVVVLIWIIKFQLIIIIKSVLFIYILDGDQEEIKTIIFESVFDCIFILVVVDDVEKIIKNYYYYCNYLLGKYEN